MGFHTGKFWKQLKQTIHVILSPMPTLIRYILIQIPGWLFLAGLLWWPVSSNWLELSTATWILLLWVLKDALLYPLAKPAYEGGAPHGGQALVGSPAETVTALSPAGMVKIQGELWQALAADGRHIAAGQLVYVTGSQDLTLQVSESALAGTGQK
ncbi:MAG: NfeD family protein [Pseudohongiellaceae bacterium]